MEDCQAERHNNLLIIFWGITAIHNDKKYNAVGSTIGYEIEYSWWIEKYKIQISGGMK